MAETEAVRETAASIVGAVEATKDGPTGPVSVSRMFRSEVTLDAWAAFMVRAGYSVEVAR